MHVRDAVAALDALPDGDVQGVGGREGGRHEPLVDAEDAVGFKDASDFSVDPAEGRGVDGGFGGVDEVEGVIWEGDVLWLHRLRFMVVEAAVCGPGMRQEEEMG